MKNSEIYQLKENMNSGEDLSEMVADINSQIDLVKSTIADLADEISDF